MKLLPLLCAVLISTPLVSQGEGLPKVDNIKPLLGYYVGTDERGYAYSNNNSELRQFHVTLKVYRSGIINGFCESTYTLEDGTFLRTEVTPVKGRIRKVFVHDYQNKARTSSGSMHGEFFSANFRVVRTTNKGHVDLSYWLDYEDGYSVLRLEKKPRSYKPLHRN